MMQCTGVRCSAVQCSALEWSKVTNKFAERILPKTSTASLLSSWPYSEVLFYRCIIWNVWTHLGQNPIFSWQSQFLTIFDPLFLGGLPSEAQGLITGTHN